ncbi:MAG TPA: DUF456 domain-containing protein [Acidimicrobiales bacterium]
MTVTEVLVAVVIAVGLIGILVPILPGSVLVAAGILVWALVTGGTTAWVVFGVAAALIVVGAVVKYLIPGRQLQVAGIPASTQWIGVALGVVGFFVIPVVGLFLGFVVGVYLAELRRVGADRAWPTTLHSLKAVGWSIVIELAFALLATWTWVAGVVAT